MSKNLYLNIDDDITRAMRKIAREPAHDITLVLPKGSLLFSDLINLKLLKAETDVAGKTISVLTMDIKGQQRARDAGFELKDFSALQRSGPSVDMVGRKKPLAARPVRRVVAAPERPASVATPKPAPQSPPTAPIQTAPIPQAAPAQPAGQPFQPVQATPPVEQLSGQRINLPSQQRQRKGPGFFKRLFHRTLLVSALTLVLIAAVLIGLLLPQATVTIYAAPQPIQRDLDITVDQAFAKASVEQLTLPAKIFQSPQQQTRQFQTSGTVDLGNKAHGSVQIYNFTGQTLKLKSSTTTLNANGKIFHLNSDITGIKPTKLQANGKDADPSSLIAPVDVTADQGGESYNLPSGTRLEITNAVLGSTPDKLYAVSMGPFSGGASRLISSITQKDLDDATAQLNTALIDSANQQLMNLQSMTIIPSGAQLAETNISFDKKVGDQTQTFFGTASANIKALIYNPNTLKDIIEQRVKITLDQNKRLATEQKEVIQPKFKSLDLDQGKGGLTVHFESLVQTDFSQDSIAPLIKGKNEADIKTTLMALDGVSRVEVKFFPFWTKSAPKIQGRVKVELKNP